MSKSPQAHYVKARTKSTRSKRHERAIKRLNKDLERKALALEIENKRAEREALKLEAERERTARKAMAPGGTKVDSSSQDATAGAERVIAKLRAQLGYGPAETHQDAPGSTNGPEAKG